MENWRNYINEDKPTAQSLKTWQNLDPENQMSADEYEKHLDSLSDEDIISGVESGIDLEQAYSKEQLNQFIEDYNREPDPVKKQKLAQVKAAPLKQALQNIDAPENIKKGYTVAKAAVDYINADPNNVDQAESAVGGLLNAVIELSGDGGASIRGVEDTKEVLGWLFDMARQNQKIALEREKKEREAREREKALLAGAEAMKQLKRIWSSPPARALYREYLRYSRRGRVHPRWRVFHTFPSIFNRGWKLRKTEYEEAMKLFREAGLVGKGE